MFRIRPTFSQQLVVQRVLWRCALIFSIAFTMQGGVANAEGIIGVKFSSLNDKRGPVIEQIVPGSPADFAALRTLSIVTKIDDRPVRTSDEFKRIINTYRPGQRVLLTIIDGNVTSEVSVVVADSQARFNPRPQSDEVKEALAELSDTSGRAAYDFNRPGTPVVKITYRPRDASNATIRIISYLPELQSIHFSDDVREGRKFSPQALAELARAPKLTELIFESYSPDIALVDEEVIDSLARIPQLRSLKIWGGKISSETFSQLARLPKLTTLSLRNTPLNDDGLKSVGQLTNLTTLDLYGTKITGAGLQHLQGLKNLVSLDLERVPLTNDDLELIAGFTDLESLDVSRSQVTNRGLKHLNGLTKLTFLGLNYSGPRKELPPEPGGGVFNELLESARYQLSPRGSETPITTTGITVDGLEENLKGLRMLKRLEVRGPEFEPSDFRRLGRLWPRAFIVSSGKTIEPTKEP